VAAAAGGETAPGNDEASSPRDRLLAAAIDFVSQHGLLDLSLRELAAAIGTSHRMLIYHFGSKEGLMVAIVQAVEAAQREFFENLSEATNVPPVELARMAWKRFTDPALAPNERLFFELYGQALQGRPGTRGFLDEIVSSWVESMAAFAVQRGVAEPTARADARLAVAVTRGLLLDLLATGELDEVTAAHERYLQLGQASGILAQPGE
jgi:AcrR family transcriptional regulator